MAAPTYTATNLSSDWDRGAVVKDYIAGVALTVGQVVYIDSSDQAQLAIATSALAGTTVGIIADAPNRYGETTIPAGQYAPVTIMGPVWGYSGLVPGTLYWVDKTTAGALTDTAPTSAYQYSVGRAIATDTILVVPGTTSPVSA